MSAVAPQIPAHDFDAIEAGTTATSAVKSRVRIPWRFIGGRALFYLFTLWAAITINFYRSPGDWSLLSMTTAVLMAALNVPLGIMLGLWGEKLTRPKRPKGKHR